MLLACLTSVARTCDVLKLACHATLDMGNTFVKPPATIAPEQKGVISVNCEGVRACVVTSRRTCMCGIGCTSFVCLMSNQID